MSGADNFQKLRTRDNAVFPRVPVPMNGRGHGGNVVEQLRAEVRELRRVVEILLQRPAVDPNAARAHFDELDERLRGIRTDIKEVRLAASGAQPPFGRLNLEPWWLVSSAGYLDVYYGYGAPTTYKGTLYGA